MSWNGEDLFKATLLGGSGGSSGGGIPQADIDAAFAALAEKGVTVPDGATSADLDDLIASIVTGGEDGISAVYGTFTGSEAGPLNIEHGLGRVPTGFMLTAPKDGAFKHWESAVLIKSDIKPDANSMCGANWHYVCVYSMAEQATLSSCGFSNAKDTTRNDIGIPNMNPELELKNEITSSFSGHGTINHVNKKYLNVFVGGDSYGHLEPGKTYEWVVW